MSLLKKLQIGDNSAGRYTQEYLLADYKCHVFRGHNEYRPDTEKRCDMIELSIIAPGREDILMYEWFVRKLNLNGRVIIELPPNVNQFHGEIKEIQFEDARCFSFEEDYHISKSQRRILKLQLVADNISIENVNFRKP